MSSVIVWVIPQFNNKSHIDLSHSIKVEDDYINTVEFNDELSSMITKTLSEIKNKGIGYSYAKIMVTFYDESKSIQSNKKTKYQRKRIY